MRIYTQQELKNIKRIAAVVAKINAQRKVDARRKLEELKEKARN